MESYVIYVDQSSNEKSNPKEFTMSLSPKMTLSQATVPVDTMTSIWKGFL